MNTHNERLAWSKMQGLLPAIVQDSDTRQVLMLGYMNPAALDATLATQRLTFYSRDKQRLWVKGETSGNYLTWISWHIDCDQDALLFLVKPQGKTCHLGTTSCFSSVTQTEDGILEQLVKVIQRRYQEQPESSYTAELFKAGIQRIAQKVGEEGLELALASVSQDDEAVLNEAADLIFHLFVLLCQRQLSWRQVLTVLARRHSLRKRGAGEQRSLHGVNE